MSANVSEVRLRETSSRLEFPSIELTDSERAEYDSIVWEQLRRALAHFSQLHGQLDKRDWKLVRRRKQMTMYRSLRGTEDPRVVLMVGTGLIEGSLEDIMEGVYCDTTDELRIVKTMLKYKFIDGAVLSVLEGRRQDDPFRFAGIKWFAAKTPGGGLSCDRDLLTYERMGLTTDATGSDVGYHILQSIDRPEWPANVLKNMLRSVTSTCFLYRRVRSDLTEVFVLGEFYGNGTMTQRLAEFSLAGKWLGVTRAPASGQAKRFSALMSSVGSQPPSTSTRCYLCSVRPKLLERFRHCTGCLQTICGPCGEPRMIFRLDPRTRKPRTKVFCRECVARVCGPRATSDDAAATEEWSSLRDRMPLVTMSPQQRPRVESDDESGYSFFSSSTSDVSSNRGPGTVVHAAYALSDSDDDAVLAWETDDELQSVSPDDPDPEPAVALGMPVGKIPTLTTAVVHGAPLSAQAPHSRSARLAQLIDATSHRGKPELQTTSSSATTADASIRTGSSRGRW
ncbi:hypothetical protein ATCC90586_000876 [Pythium insidiosum]|nr:hypothetical protein ATCC90586_000876 [Pythium insidiosum]